MKIQSFIIKHIFIPIGKRVDNLSEQLKIFTFFLGGTGLYFLFFLYGSPYEFPRYLIFFVLGCLMLGIMILSTIPASFQKLKLDHTLGFLWFCTGFFILLSALLYNLDNLSSAIMFLIIYPTTWYIWSQKPIETIFRLLVKLCIGTFIIFLIISALFFPIHQSQYASFFNNVNSTSAYLCLVFACLLVEILDSENYRFAFWNNLILIGIAFTLVFYTNSRTGQLTCLMTFLIVSCLHIYNRRSQWGHQLIFHIFPILVSCIIFLPTTVYLFKGINKVTRSTISISQPKESFNHEIGNVIDNIKTENENEEESESPGVQDFLEKNKEKTSGNWKSLDELSTGRLSIWKAFLKHVRPFGTDGNVKVYINSRGRYYVTCHNTLLEYAVHYGAVCAVFYFLFIIFAGLKSLKFATKKANIKYNLLPLAITIAYGVSSMLDSLETPFAYMLTLYYFFIQTPLIFHKLSAQEQQEINKIE